MAGPAVWLVEAANQFFPVAPNLQEIGNAKVSIDAYQAWERAEIQRILPEFGALWDLKGKDVLDVGCGLGGKTLYYAESGARTVTGLDLRPGSVQSVQDLSRERGFHAVLPSLANAARMPFADNSFDVVISVNVFEHVDDLYHALRECKRVVRPHGLLFLHFPPFYSPWGAHLEGWINFPWPHLFFSDETLIEAARRIDQRNHHNSAYIPPAKVNWAEHRRLPELNRVTVSQFMHLARAVELDVIHSEMLPFGRHFLSRRGTVARWALAGLRYLAQMPGLREFLTTKMVFILGRK